MSTPRIAQSEIEPLPRWARIALARRCLGRVRATIRPAPGPSRILDDVLARLESAAVAGIAGDDVSDAAASAYTLALDHVDGKADGADEDAIVVTCMLAHATAFAAEAATVADGRSASHLVAQSLDFAMHACRLAAGGDVNGVAAGMRADLDDVRSKCEGWDDRTGVTAEAARG